MGDAAFSRDLREDLDLSAGVHAYRFETAAPPPHRRITVAWKADAAAGGPSGIWLPGGAGATVSVFNLFGDPVRVETLETPPASGRRIFLELSWRPVYAVETW